MTKKPFLCLRKSNEEKNFSFVIYNLSKLSACVLQNVPQGCVEWLIVNDCSDLKDLDNRFTVGSSKSEIYTGVSNSPLVIGSPPANFSA